MAEVDVMWGLRTGKGSYCSVRAGNKRLVGSWISRPSAVRNNDVTKRTDAILRRGVSNKGIADIAPALNKMVTRLGNLHKCKAIYRVHADRAKELTGDRHKQWLENCGVMVTSTAGYDSNANGRAE